MYRVFILMLPLLTLPVYGATFKINLPPFLKSHAQDVPVPNEQELIISIDETFNNLLEKKNILTQKIEPAEILQLNKLFSNFDKYMQAYVQHKPLPVIKRWYPIAQEISRDLINRLTNGHLKANVGIIALQTNNVHKGAIRLSPVQTNPNKLHSKLSGIKEYLNIENLEQSVKLLTTLESALFSLAKEPGITVAADKAAIFVFYAYASKLNRLVSKLLSNFESLHSDIEAQIQSVPKHRQLVTLCDKTFDKLLEKENVFTEKMTSAEALGLNKVFREFNKFMQVYIQRYNPLPVIKKWYPAIQGMSIGLIRDLYWNTGILSQKNGKLATSPKAIEQQRKSLEQAVTLLSTLGNSVQKLSKNPGTNYKPDIVALEVFSAYVSKLAGTLSKVYDNFVALQNRAEGR